MAKIFGKEMSKKEILRRVGDIEQIAQITSFELKDGNANGVRALDVRNGSGLRFLVIADRGLDITTAEICGIPLAIRFHAGEMGPNFFEDHPLAFVKSWAGGLLTTCGLTHVGGPEQEENEHMVQHGNYNHIAAKNVQFEGSWEGDEYKLQIRGRIREVSPFYPNLELRRKITTYLGSRKILIEDEIENIGFKTSPLMLLYHCNLGFPLLDKGSEVKIDSASTVIMEGMHTDDLKEWNKVSDPLPDYPEYVYYHDVVTDKDGNCIVGIENNNFSSNRKLAFNIKYKKEQLPNLSNWKCLRNGEYIIAIEPCNCHPEGRIKERNVFKTLKFIEPGEIKNFSLEFEAILE